SHSNSFFSRSSSKSTQSFQPSLRTKKIVGELVFVRIDGGPLDLQFLGVFQVGVGQIGNLEAGDFRRLVGVLVTQGQAAELGGDLRIVGTESNPILQVAGSRSGHADAGQVGFLGAPVAPGLIGLGDIAGANGDADGSSRRRARFPGQRSPFADNLGIEDAGGDG